MEAESTFELTVHVIFYGSFTWKLDRGLLCYRGTDGYHDPTMEPIPVSAEQIARFVELLDSLDVWHWKRDYEPEDIGYSVEDGGSWKFETRINGRTCQTAGTNAYPSLDDAAMTSLEPERFGRLLQGFEEIFRIPPHKPNPVIL